MATDRDWEGSFSVIQEAVELHPDSAWAILQALEPLRYVLPGVLFHHERFDGAGYPDGLVGERIPHVKHHR